MAGWRGDQVGLSFLKPSRLPCFPACQSHFSPPPPKPRSTQTQTDLAKSTKGHHVPQRPRGFSKSRRRSNAPARRARILFLVHVRLLCDLSISEISFSPCATQRSFQVHNTSIPVIRREICFAPGIRTPDLAVLRGREGRRVLVPAGPPDPSVAVGRRRLRAVSLVWEPLSRAALSPEFRDFCHLGVAAGCSPTARLRETLDSDAGPGPDGTLVYP